MKIHLDFNNMAEMFLYCKTIVSSAEVQAQPKKELKDSAEAWKKQSEDWQAKYEHTLANLNRAYERIRILDPRGNTMNVSEADIGDKKVKGALNNGIDTLDMPVRPSNCLTAGDITTIGQLIQMTRGDLLRLPNLGRRSLKLIEDALFAKYNVYLKGVE